MISARQDLSAEIDSGTAYWVTGLPGAGKTTLAQKLAARLSGQGRPVIRLDGDRLRHILGDRYGYGQEDRHALAMTYAGLCQEITSQGPDVVCATVSMFHDVRAWSRAHIARYCEIYLRAPVAVLAERHPKGLYAAALAKRIRNVPGVDQVFEEPEAPDVIIEDDGTKTPSRVADELFRFLKFDKEAA